jgi:hypothetical protein
MVDNAIHIDQKAAFEQIFLGVDFWFFFSVQ